MQQAHWISALGCSIVAIGLAIPADLSDWSAPAIYGSLLASIVTAVVLFALTDFDQDTPRGQ